MTFGPDLFYGNKIDHTTLALYFLGFLSVMKQHTYISSYNVSSLTLYALVTENTFLDERVQMSSFYSSIFPSMAIFQTHC
jgi:hypothetical protein